MLDHELRTMIDEVKDGRMDRRGFVQRMLAFGLTAPMATQILAIGGVALAEGPSVYKPTKRGGGGALKLLWWQGPTLLNPHFATGTKDQDGSRLFYEPLACWDPRSEEHTSELQSPCNLVCRLLLEKKKNPRQTPGHERTQRRVHHHRSHRHT